MIAILDYGSGNIRSAQRAFEKSGQSVTVTSDFEKAVGAKGLVIPGVGAFGACMEGLKTVRGDEIIRERLNSGKKIFGICVGMQVLFAESEELYNGQIVRGVGVFEEAVQKLSAPVLPHIGWNSLQQAAESKMFTDISKERFYFVHSYAVKGEVSGVENIKATYGERFIAAVNSDLITATQFHPEKSGNAGLKLIENWASSL